MAKFCEKCGKELEKDSSFCAKCGANTNNKTNNQKGKSKIAAGIMGILVGWLGVHNFYLGYTGKGIAQLLISVLTCFVLSGISAIWGLIEGIMILTGNIDKDADGNPLTD